MWIARQIDGNRCETVYALQSIYKHNQINICFDVFPNTNYPVHPKLSGVAAQIVRLL